MPKPGGYICVCRDFQEGKLRRWRVELTFQTYECRARCEHEAKTLASMKLPQRVLRAKRIG